MIKGYHSTTKLEERFATLLHSKFEQKWPDTFVKNKTTDPDLYERSNGAMYTWYIHILNSFSIFDLEGKYKRDKYDIVNSDYAKAFQFIEDLEKSDNWVELIMSSMPSRR